MTSAPLIAIAAVVGMVSGTHTAIWGMYKDAAHEGFSAIRFSRSIVVGGCVAVLLYAMLQSFAANSAALAIPSPGALLVLFGLAYAGERGIVEVWKTFFRNEDQSKYTIPMQFYVRGAPVSPRLRAVLGTAYAVVILAIIYGMAMLDAGRTGPASRVTVALVGLSVGIVIACGGAWKDAPTEGFELLKFFRSPAMTVSFALLLSLLSDSYVEIAIAAIGYERAAAETYKTFFFPSKPRGKFAGKPVLFPHMLSMRRYFVPVFVAIWLALLTAAAKVFA
ncbi:MAG TPA: hypothetical protein VKH19_15435 [Gemmatimonadaceae bacterium]|nr:hypothetical protein [Gemmatimonadaceae bacterium]